MILWFEKSLGISFLIPYLQKRVYVQDCFFLYFGLWFPDFLNGTGLTVEYLYNVYKYYDYDPLLAIRIYLFAFAYTQIMTKSYKIYRRIIR